MLSTPPVVVYLAQEKINALLTYDTSLPTGTTVGKQWKCRSGCSWLGFDKEDWLLGEYTEHSDPNKVGIIWSKIVKSETNGVKEKAEQSSINLLSRWKQRHSKTADDISVTACNAICPDCGEELSDTPDEDIPVGRSKIECVGCGSVILVVKTVSVEYRTSVVTKQ